MKKFFHTVLAASALALLPACINIQYDGISAEPLSESEPVGLYFSADQIPVKTYDVLGEATATAGEAYSATEVEAKLRSFARVHGANAVLIVDIKRTVAGKARPDQLKNQNGGAWTPDDSSGSSFRHFREDMLDYSKTEGPEKPVYDILIKAKLLRLPAE